MTDQNELDVEACQLIVGVRVLVDPPSLDEVLAASRSREPLMLSILSIGPQRYQPGAVQGNNTVSVEATLVRVRLTHIHDLTFDSSLGQYSFKGSYIPIRSAGSLGPPSHRSKPQIYHVVVRGGVASYTVAIYRP